jgi:polysaccharide deacetylase 2 family uncharacterized protein YibQ
MKALAVASGIVFWTLVLGIAFFAFFPGSKPEPVAILQIEPPPEAGAPGAAAPVTTQPAPGAPAVPAPGNLGLPLGFGVAPSQLPQAPPAPQAPAPAAETQGAVPAAPGGQGEASPVPALPPAEPGAAAPPEAAPPPGAAAPPDQQGAAPASPNMQQAAFDAGAQPPPPPPPMPEPGNGPVTLPSVPVAELVEESQYGPLPKVAADGRRAIDVYSRPSRYAVAAPGTPPRVAILVTGLGHRDGPSSDVLAGLPAPVSVAYGAYGRSLQDSVSDVRAEGHEVLLQIPLEPENYPTVDPGPHTLLTTLPPQDNIKRLQWLMSRYTGYVGVTNHMGGKFEATAESLQPVLEEVKRRGLLYVDSEGVANSAAGNIAGTIGLDYSVANVQLDAGDTAQQLAKLEQLAKEQGAAIGVARASPATVKQLSAWAEKLEGKGIVLVPVSAAVRSRAQS